MSQNDKDDKTTSDEKNVLLSDIQMAQISEALRSTVIDIAQGERAIAAQAKRVVVERPKEQTPKVKVKERPVIKMPEDY